MPKNTRIPIDLKPPTRRPTQYRWLLPAFLMLPLLGGLVYALTASVTPAPPALPEVSPPEEKEIAEATATSLPSGDRVEFVVRRNDTLERIFRQLRLNLTDLTAILSLPEGRQTFNRIRPGDRVTVIHEDGVVHALKRRISETEILAFRRSDDGFTTEVIETPIEVTTAHAHGTINSSLFVAARAAGMSPETILQLANDIFGWQIDFALDIRPGDRFSVLYEQKYRDNKHIGDGRILAAEFINSGEKHQAVYYASADGAVEGYFTPEGNSMRRQFLRAPLDFTRVSSNFNPARRHPILNTIRAHQGVDYAAPTGTIVKASGDGRVSFAGYKGGYGKTVILEHGGRISTLYAHLSRFAQGLHVGKRVKQGETIGYVGRTGAATGAHLHYEYRVNGIHKNPRTVPLPAAQPIPATYLADFQSTAQTLIAALEPPVTASIGPTETSQP